MLGSTGCQPVVGGSLPPTLIGMNREAVCRCIRQAAERGRLAACAPQKEKRRFLCNPRAPPKRCSHSPRNRDAFASTRDACATRKLSGAVIGFPLSPAKRLRSTPLLPAAAVLFRPARSVNFSRRNPPESAIRDGRDRLGRRAGSSPADQRT